MGDEADLLEQFPGLQHLNLRNTGITDLSPLSELIGLNYLNLHANPDIDSIVPLVKLDKLKTLILQDVPVGEQIDVLLNFPNLIKLNLRNTGITETSVIGQLAANGAFKDNPKNDLLGSIDIQDNPLDHIENDSYFPLRDYWENISIRAPFILPYYATLQPPEFSQPAGFYPGSFLLELSS